MTKTSMILGSLGAVLLGPGSAWSFDACDEAYDETRPQYVVGYGSLMETKSKLRSSPTAGPNIPVVVAGFSREWNIRGEEIGFSTTYLGIVEKTGEEMVATIYRDPSPGDIEGTDMREEYYCRRPVNHDWIDILDDSSLSKDAQVWIYVNKPGSSRPPNSRWPIVQSYVDIFVNGCIELQAQVTRKDFDFVEQCITTTHGWSKDWVNDRLYPRRPFIYEPNATKIDAVLHKHLPKLFESIEIE